LGNQEEPPEVKTVMAMEIKRIHAVSLASSGETWFRIKLRILHTTRQTAERSERSGRLDAHVGRA
jgi:hypothetical protein